MWCTRCHTGSPSAKPYKAELISKKEGLYRARCNQCGNDAWVDKNPLPTKCERTLRNTKKDKEKANAKKSENKSEGDRGDIERITTGTLKAIDYAKGA